MDLGCFDMGCVSVSDKQNADRVLDSEEKEGVTPPVEIKTSASKSAKVRLFVLQSGSMGCDFKIKGLGSKNCRFLFWISLSFEECVLSERNLESCLA